MKEIIYVIFAGVVAAFFAIADIRIGWIYLHVCIGNTNIIVFDVRRE